MLGLCVCVCDGRFIYMLYKNIKQTLLDIVYTIRWHFHSQCCATISTISEVFHFSSPQRETLYSLRNSSLLFPSRQPLVTADISVSLNLPILDSSCKESHSVFPSGSAFSTWHGVYSSPLLQQVSEFHPFFVVEQYSILPDDGIWIFFFSFWLL